MGLRLGLGLGSGSGSVPGSSNCPSYPAGPTVLAQDNKPKAWGLREGLFAILLPLFDSVAELLRLFMLLLLLLLPQKVS